MIHHIVLLSLFGIINGHILFRRYRVAAIANSVLFFFIFVFYSMISSFPIFVNFWVGIFGEVNYITLREALLSPIHYIDGGISTIMVLMIVFYVLIPTCSVISIVKKIRESCKTFTYDYSIVVEFQNDQIEEPVFNPLIIFNNNIYLEKEVLLI